MDEFNLKKECELLNSFEKIINSNKHNFNEFIDDISQTFTTNNNLKSKFQEETNEEKTQTFFNDFSTSSIDTSKDNEKRIIALESKCKELHDQVDRLTKERENAFEEIDRLKDQIISQSIYCTSLGAVLSNLTWRASRFPQIVDIWLTIFQNKIEELLSIINGTFGAFVNTYRNVFPPTSNIEYQFVIGLLGIVTNISASPEGREFLITNSNGIEFVQKIIKLTPELPSASGSLSLKRLILMILYNVSMNKTGLQYLLEFQLEVMLNHCMEDESSSEEVQLLCLRVLQSVTYDLTEPKYIYALTTTISIKRIETMARSKRSDISDAAIQVIKHLQETKKIIK